ncbi:MAG: 2-oxoglutarate dehydrogenase E1 component [Omnitrophica WOR_2 bacterium]
MDFWSEFQGPNFGYVLELYERYLDDPQSVSPEIRAFFSKWPPAFEAETPISPLREPLRLESLNKATAVANLAEAIRHYGYLAADLDPLGSPPPGDPALDPAVYDISEADLHQLPASLVGGPNAGRYQDAWDAIQALRSRYIGKAGFDYGHVVDAKERDWLRNATETERFRQPLDSNFSRNLLERLTHVEALERFLQRSFPGKTRFSIEGVDMLIPILDEVICEAADDGICMVFLGMAHRGRLNVLAHILQMSYEKILAEFQDPAANTQGWHTYGYTGDVKYHKGARASVDEGNDRTIVVSMPPNPSHLEFIDPVVEGMARSADSVMDQPGKIRFYPKASLPILIHGDASFPGQGVVSETMTMSRLPGYNTAGTIHIITNNQLGYTATVSESRSSLFASDYAKGLKIPIIHVNADDPVACLEAAATAFAFRAEFQKDFMIDLIGYRRYGHNEGDEPSFTQPLMYKKIDAQPMVRALWAEHLVKQGIVPAELPEELLKKDLDELQAIMDRLKPEEALSVELPAPAPPGAAQHAVTAVSLESLKTLNEALLAVPDGFHLNRKLDRPRKRRSQALDDPQEATIDWPAAEDLAFATILVDGIPIRLTGQDTERGTFSQRHAVLHDIETGSTYIPLQNIQQARASFEIHNSPLMESGALGFEFGFSLMFPNRLVLWEAQYGDFINVAQAVIDEFIVSARTKWGQKPSLVLLLPHGNEGQGPDHSSARPERFLSLTADINLRMDYPTSAAQYFHLLRRQAALLETDPLPLIILTPKGLLRHPMVASRPVELAEGSWQPVIDDPEKSKSPQKVKRLVLCSGRISIDLIGSEEHAQAYELAIVRLEQLYPLPDDHLKSVFAEYPSLEEVIWVQEEPQNMGFWEYLRPRLLALIDGRWPLHYVGRPASSSPAEGSASLYAINQRAIIERVYSPELSIPEGSALVERG